MTLKDIQNINKNVLTCADVAPFLKVNPNSLRCQIQQDPRKVNFPTIQIGTRILIPKDNFIKFFRGEKQ